MRPDIDNLFKGIIDSLFQSKVNQVLDGIETDKNGNPIHDEFGNDIPHFKQRIDDSRVVHTEMLKLKATEESPEGFTLIVRNLGLEAIS
ncbi:hypothetical protein [Lentilactobacillus senioris]|uniref:hypothetical protein n=1 Tax=Lentilactobacillus senioris TaxID=931534 RepID=UPI000A7F2F1C|nr:hypothetical protein [Lentilactobacillus senioris]